MSLFKFLWGFTNLGLITSAQVEPDVQQHNVGVPLGNIVAKRQIDGIIGVEREGDVDAATAKSNHVAQLISKIREYQADPDDDFKAHWGDIMHEFSPDSSYTFDVNEPEIFFFNLTPQKPIFRAAWVVTSGASETGLYVSLYDAEGDLVYYSKNKSEGLIAFEATTYGQYTMDFSIGNLTARKHVSIMTAVDRLNDLCQGSYNMNDTKGTVLQMLRLASDVKRSARFFQKRRQSHNEKINKNLSWVTMGAVGGLVCSFLSGLLQVASIKHLVRKRIRTYVF